MKKVILGSWFALLGLSALAQQKAPAVPPAMADMPQVSTNAEIRDLANKLQLNEGQYIRLRDLSKARQEQVAEINSMYSNDPAMRQAKLRAAQQEFDAQLAQSIGQKHFTAYLELQGRNPANNAAYQAAGYGGRSLEESTGEESTGTDNETATQSPDTAAPEAQPLDTNIDQGRVEVSDRVIKVNTDEGRMKVKAKKEKAETAELEYKTDRDESKVKTKDGKVKAKSEKGKTKIESPKGKVKMKDGEVKVNPKQG